MSKISPTPAGFICTKCGKRNEFGAYVAAHYQEKLIHTCECGKRSSVQHYCVTDRWRGQKLAEVYYQ